MSLSVSISPSGTPVVAALQEDGAPGTADSQEQRIIDAFEAGAGEGLLQLAGLNERALPPDVAFLREFARRYLTALCHRPATEEQQAEPLGPPGREELGFVALSAPPMRGLEYLSAEALAGWWEALDKRVQAAIIAEPGGATAYLARLNPLWHMVGRVTFHLAENKRNPEQPFAFLATYASRISAQNRVQHMPLGQALTQYIGASQRSTLLNLLKPVQVASERSALIKHLVESRRIYHPQAWTPQQAYQFLKEIPLLDESGVLVRLPDWWKAAAPPRPVVNVTMGSKRKSHLDKDAILDLDVAVELEGQRLSRQETDALLQSAGGLMLLRGKWVEVDKAKLAEALDQWEKVSRQAEDGEISFLEGMRLLAGVRMGPAAQAVEQTEASWAQVSAGPWLRETLEQLGDPERLAAEPPPGLDAQLRPYQQTGVGWLRFMMQLRLGACLADDMGLGKTIQVLGLLLHQKAEQAGAATPNLLVAPASLLANWQAEIARFAPSIKAVILHPSQNSADLADERQLSETLADCDLAITTYGMLARLQSVRDRPWRLAILDEAQAIKNHSTRQSRSAKELKSQGRIVMTGTPVENRLGDLWSLFDFLNPGLLGGATTFSKYVNQLAGQNQPNYGPLRRLVRPYILRRLKTDKRVIADLPDKTEMQTWCSLSPQQAVLYSHSVKELADVLEQTPDEGIQRKGLILSYLMRFKQICNHPSQWLGDGKYEPGHSGKFARLGEVCEELAQRQEKVLIFTQFREITAPLADYLAAIFHRPGLILHGQTPVAKRRLLVEDFQRPQGPPFFVLSLKAGGTGLNLTSASHVIHFDRWWNPAVENQATDRAFRIGQKKNVFVHKFVCAGTVEEKIDKMIQEKVGLSRQLLDQDTSGEALLTQMNNEEILRFVSLDLRRI